jgi:hypothetical protein
VSIDDGTLRTLAAGHVPHDGRGLCATLAKLMLAMAPRTTPPTAAEMAAHAVAGGVWLTAWPWRSGVWADAVVPALRARDAVEPGMTWLPLDAQRRPCAWPTPARLPGCETAGPCGYCDHPERPR